MYAATSTRSAYICTLQIDQVAILKLQRPPQPLPAASLATPRRLHNRLPLRVRLRLRLQQPATFSSSPALSTTISDAALTSKLRLDPSCNVVAVSNSIIIVHQPGRALSSLYLINRGLPSFNRKQSIRHIPGDHPAVTIELCAYAGPAPLAL